MQPESQFGLTEAMSWRPPKQLISRLPQHSEPCPRAQLTELLGLDDVPDAIAYTILGDHVADGLRIRSLVFENMLGATVPAVLIWPAASTGPLPAVVCTPGTCNDAQSLTERRFHRADDGHRPLRGWARELARRGFVTLSLTLHMNDVRRGTDQDFEQAMKLLAPYGVTPMGLLVDEVLRGARLLAGNEHVDDQRLGVAGFSLGGNASWYAFACAPWLHSAAIICGGLGSLRTQIQLGDLIRHSPYFYVPRLLRHFDHPELVRRCIAPRPLLLIAPTRDEDMPIDGVNSLHQHVQPAYANAGADSSLCVYQPEGRHEFRQPYFETVADWFNKQLTHTPTNSPAS